MYKKMTLGWLLLVLVALLFLAPLQAQHLVRLTERNHVQLALDYFTKAVQKTDTATVLAWLGTEAMVKGQTIDPGPQIRLIFDRVSQRRARIASPPGAENWKFWDLEITPKDISFTADSTEAVVHCKLRLWAAETVESGTVREASETFKFKRTGTGWRIAGFDNLLDFLEREVSLHE
jgi:hypothetical protein